MKNAVLRLQIPAFAKTAATNLSAPANFALNAEQRERDKNEEKL